jgi:hypothetical protein
MLQARLSGVARLEKLSQHHRERVRVWKVAYWRRKSGLCLSVPSVQQFEPLICSNMTVLCDAMANPGPMSPFHGIIPTAGFAKYASGFKDYNTDRIRM